ncbi:Suppressor of the cold-sensitive snRNP bioproteinsis mutant brr1-1 [Perkinsus chesapeaki]|uniref:subtilisin n=1 Tax=Perkinsus chesapeaki TaxID=330153 RepID=A0A7J6LFD4_PERCH|nr:Suppressor of the cold-sensitive snRNP bioproteinsis mutant brr1-1 [Perkinsus chesapeaki]
MDGLPQEARQAPLELRQARITSPGGDGNRSRLQANIFVRKMLFTSFCTIIALASARKSLSGRVLVLIEQKGGVVSQSTTIGVSKVPAMARENGFVVPKALQEIEAYLENSAQVESIPNLGIEIVSSAPVSSDICEYLMEAKKHIGDFEVHCHEELTLHIDETTVGRSLAADLNVTDPFAPQQKAFEQMNMRRFWELTDGLAAPVSVAIFDNGVDYYSYDIRNRFVIRKKGYNTINSSLSSLPDGGSGFGTRAASIIAAERNNSYGMAGVSDNARLFSMKVLTNDSTRYNTEAHILEGFAVAVQYKIDVIYLRSAWLPTTSSSRALYQKAVEAFAASGGIIVVSAGDNGVVSPWYPCRIEHPQLLCVAALDDKNPAQLWRSSNYGPPVAVAAPGVMLSYNFTSDSFDTTRGTYVSAAFTAGVAATLRGLGISSANITDIIRLTAEPLDDEDYDKVTDGAIDPVTAAEAAILTAGPIAEAELLTFGERFRAAARRGPRAFQEVARAFARCRMRIAKYKELTQFKGSNGEVLYYATVTGVKYVRICEVCLQPSALDRNATSGASLWASVSSGFNKNLDNGGPVEFRELEGMLPFKFERSDAGEHQDCRLAGQICGLLIAVGYKY